MQTLNKVIAAVQREVMAAIAENKPSPAGVTLEPGRVVLSLGLALRARNDGEIEVYVAGPGEQPCHTVRVEFAIGSPTTATRATPGEGVVNALMEVFGVPSFDSSARATVFRETLAPLSEEQSHTLIRSLAGDLNEGDAPLKSPRHMILRLLEKGPAGVDPGVAVLNNILRRHELRTVLRLIEETWKTPEAWAG